MSRIGKLGRGRLAKAAIAVALVPAAAAGAGPVERLIAPKPEAAPLTHVQRLAAQRMEGTHNIRTSLGGFPAWAHFTNPVAAKKGVDRTIIREVIRLVDAVPAGESIDISTYQFTIRRVADALLRAERRGVNVRLVLDWESQRKWRYPGDELERLTHVKTCNPASKSSCVSSEGIMHTKLIRFSKTTDPTGAPRENVTWFSSANMHSESGQETFNNSFTVYGDRSLYAQLGGYFDNLWTERRAEHNDFFSSDEGRGLYVAPSGTFYASPEQDTDLLAARLRKFANLEDGEVLVGSAKLQDSRPEVTRALIALKRRGNDVKVTIGPVDDHPGTPFIGRTAFRMLRDAGIPVRFNAVHDKTVLVNGRLDGRLVRRYFTGSHNLSNAANSKNDELLAELNPDEALYRASRSHFFEMFESGRDVVS